MTFNWKNFENTNNKLSTFIYLYNISSEVILELENNAIGILLNKNKVSNNFWKYG